MPTLRTTRPVTRRIVEDVTAEVNVELETRKSGSVDVVINGQKALRISASGYLRRFPGLTPEAGVRRLPDGRIAIKPADGAGDTAD